MKRIEARTIPGTKDLLPKDMYCRQYIGNILRREFERYGFQPLHTPSIEYYDILTGKYGAEGEKLLYRFSDRGGRDLALIYDLTVSLARVVASHSDLVIPFKRYQIQSVWRADRPQKGRFREFIQCDIDIVGSSSPLAEVEILDLSRNALKTLGFKSCLLAINHRSILKAIIIWSGFEEDQVLSVCRIIDKLDKIGFKGVREEFQKAEFREQNFTKLLQVFKHPGTSEELLAYLSSESILISKEAQEAADLMLNIFKYYNELNNQKNIPLDSGKTDLSKSDSQQDGLILDLSLARGLDYYTGPIFEIRTKDLKIGSLAGGGRYDNLIEIFSTQPTPAVGLSFGLDRISVAMEELGLLPRTKTNTQVLVALFDESCIPEALKLTKELRADEINTEIYFEVVKLKKQFSYADQRGIGVVVVLGPDEIKNNTVTVKDMLKEEQLQVPRVQLRQTIKRLISIKAFS